MTPPAQQTDAQLLERTRAGDVSAYDELYRRHVSDARRVARIVTDDSTEAEEVVAEAFNRVLARLYEGGGPPDVLTPYLRTIVRRLAIDRHRRSNDQHQPLDPAVLAELPSADDDIAETADRQLVRAAFESLPQRWQRVLWHTEIEGRPPARLTPDLGSSPNAVAALAYRAQEGLRQAFLAVHLAASAPPLCRPYVPKLAAYIRHTLPEEEDVAVAIHLDTCAHCRDRRDELLLLLSDVRGVLVPALLGMPASSTLLASAAPAAIPDGGVDATEATTTASGRSPRGFVRVAAMSLVSAAAAAAVAFAAISAMSPQGRTGGPAAAPPAVTSGLESAVAGTPEVPSSPSADPAQTPAEAPSPSDEPTAEGAPTEVSRVVQPPPTTDEPGPTDDVDASVQPERSSPAQPNSPDNKAGNRDPKPASNPEPESEPDSEAPRPGSHDAPGSNDTRGNQNPGTPPPSPWACEIVSVLPWCD